MKDLSGIDGRNGTPLARECDDKMCCSTQLPHVQDPPVPRAEPKKDSSHEMDSREVYFVADGSLL